MNSDAPYVRSGLDTITTANAVRTLDHTVSMTFTNITGPRIRPASLMFTRKNLMNQATGTITGVYTATVTVQRGSTYKEKSIEREFTITLGSGEGAIGIHGDGRGFRANLLTGEQKF